MSGELVQPVLCNGRDDADAPPCTSPFPAAGRAPVFCDTCTHPPPTNPPRPRRPKEANA